MLQVPVEGVIDQVPPGLLGGGNDGAKRQALGIQDPSPLHCRDRDTSDCTICKQPEMQQLCQPPEHGLSLPLAPKKGTPLTRVHNGYHLEAAGLHPAPLLPSWQQWPVDMSGQGSPPALQH